MPPKVKTTKDAIVSTAMEIVRTQGEQALNARAVAAVLGCSTQPIFSNFATMEDLRTAVIWEANALCNEYIRREVEAAQVEIARFLQENNRRSPSDKMEKAMMDAWKKKHQK